MAIKLGPLGALGKRDLAFSLGGLLEQDELLATIDVTSLQSDRLQINGATKNASQIVQDGITIPVGRGVVFGVEGLVGNTRGVSDIDIHFVGDAGTEDTLRVSQPIVPQLTD